MDRRAFFGALVFGGAALPGSLKAVSVPLAPQTFTLTAPVVRGMTFYGNVFLKRSVNLMERCKVVMPWTWRRGHWITWPPVVNVEDRLPTDPIGLVSRCFFAHQPPPFWARVLRLDR